MRDKRSRSQHRTIRVPKEVLDLFTEDLKLRDDERIVYCTNCKAFRSAPKCPGQEGNQVDNCPACRAHSEPTKLVIIGADTYSVDHMEGLDSQVEEQFNTYEAGT